ncbi:MAG: biotin/lipoyl-containing protein [Porticoccaceae bacterium]|nr:biotin/lipoyl-binding protein [Pseudomonadales bacterium]MCP5172115.1 biotin/lipoyl-binding protein [Pseudomonadales bacterium]
MKPVYRFNSEQYSVHPVRCLNGLTLNIDGRQVHAHVDWQDNSQCLLTIAGNSYQAYAVQDDQQLYIHLANRTWVLDIVADESDLVAAGAAGSREDAPMPGVVIELRVCEGDTVANGDTLLLIESMKLQIEIKAQAAGVVTQLPFTAGASFNKGDLLAAIDVASEESDQ